MEKPLVDKDYILEKYPGKGGWTYAAIPEVLPNKHSHFGWVKVKGSIDNYQFKNYRLQPMGNGCLFLPVKAEIRKLLNKKEGDKIRVKLFEDTEPLEIPEELLTCLKEEPRAMQVFLQLTEGEQKNIINLIFSAKKEETKVKRIAETINKLLSIK